VEAWFPVRETASSGIPGSTAVKEYRTFLVVAEPMSVQRVDGLQGTRRCLKRSKETSRTLHCLVPGQSQTAKAHLPEP
jgi:hypothetical protein